MDSISKPIAVLTRNGITAVLYYANQEEANSDKVTVCYWDAETGIEIETWTAGVVPVWTAAKAWIEDRCLTMWVH